MPSAQFLQYGGRPAWGGRNEEAALPKPINAREAADAREGRRMRRLARGRLGPRDRIPRARMVALRWDGRRVPDIAAEPGCPPKAVRASDHRG